MSVVIIQNPVVTLDREELVWLVARMKHLRPDCTRETCAKCRIEFWLRVVS